MKILLANAHPYLPQTMGGAQSSMHDLAVELARRGHEVSVLSGFTKQGWIGLRSRVQRKVQHRKYSIDYGLGYPVYRAWNALEVVADVVRHIGADVVVPQSWLPVRFAQELRDVDTRVVIYLRNVETEELGGDPRDLEGTSYIANSQFTAARWKALFGIESKVIYPLVRRENYQTETTRENVTFINPHPQKGLEIALGIAKRCPEIPFVFVKSWTLNPEITKQLKMALATLPNVELKSSTRDMKSIYGKAKIVLAPSQWEEAFGRIAVEAHFSGIPVVASARGGLPEAVGPGGILIKSEATVDTWAEAVRKLWHDQAFYARKSQAARDYSIRPEMDSTQQIDNLLAILGGPS